MDRAEYDRASKQTNGPSVTNANIESTASLLLLLGQKP